MNRAGALALVAAMAVATVAVLLAPAWACALVAAAERQLHVDDLLRSAVQRPLLAAAHAADASGCRHAGIGDRPGHLPAPVVRAAGLQPIAGRDLRAKRQPGERPPDQPGHPART